nr:integrase, catalytic region, zinc finger, CCHC-type, peptidase aspartic, catalytic [Tanacetum cinerariifolium]
MTTLAKHIIVGGAENRPPMLEKSMYNSWSKFVTDVKLAKSLYTTNYDQLNQATIQDGRVTIQQVQGRQSYSFSGTRNKGIATTSRENYAARQPRVVKCYNFQGERLMARQCNQPKRPRNTAWFNEKLKLAEAQEAESKEKESKYIDKKIVLEKQNKELENIIYKMYRSTQEMHMLTKPKVFYDNTHKQALVYQNPFNLKKAQRIQPTLYDGSVIAKEHAVNSVMDDEETLILEEESRSKMLDKQNDSISNENKIKISPIDYSKLNKIKEDFGKRLVAQKELSAKQAFWLKHSFFSKTPVTSHTPVRIEAPSELPKDEVLEFMIKFLKMIQVRLNVTVRNIKTDNGTEFFNQTLKAYYEEVRISHQTYVACALQQNGVVKRRSRTLVEVARTIEDLEPVISTGTPSSTTIDQDAPSTSNSQTSQETPPLVIPLSVEEVDHDIKVAHMDNNPFVEFPISEPSFEESSISIVIPNHVHSINQPPKHINKSTKDHLIDNVIGNPSRPVSTRQQLQDEALFLF